MPLCVLCQHGRRPRFTGDQKSTRKNEVSLSEWRESSTSDPPGGDDPAPPTLPSFPASDGRAATGLNKVLALWSHHIWPYKAADVCASTPPVCVLFVLRQTGRHHDPSEPQEHLKAASFSLRRAERSCFDVVATLAVPKHGKVPNNTRGPVYPSCPFLFLPSSGRRQSDRASTR